MEKSTLKYTVVRTLCAGIVLLSAVGNAQLAKGASKFVGNITQNGSGKPPAQFTELWNQATAENGCKWGSVEGTEGQYNWAACDVAYNWAKDNGRLFKFHALIWGGQYPSWLKNKNVDQTRTAIEKWFDAVQKKYPDLKQIDVVNEAIRTSDGKYHSPYTETKQIDALGGDAGGSYKFVITAFEMARKRWPNAVLIYNDYNTFQWQINEGIDLVKKLKAGGSNLVDAYGQQAHDLKDMSSANFKAALKKIYDQTQIPLVITEYDIGTTNDALQKQRYEEQITEFMNQPYVFGITLWGYIFGQTWINSDGQNGTSGIIKNGADRPAMTWLKQHLASNKGVNTTKFTMAYLSGNSSGIEGRDGSLANTGKSGLVMRNVNGRMVMGIERDGQFQEMSALGRR